jgi:hypothetical protein
VVLVDSQRHRTLSLHRSARAARATVRGSTQPADDSFLEIPPSRRSTPRRLHPRFMEGGSRMGRRGCHGSSDRSGSCKRHWAIPPRCEPSS